MPAMAALSNPQLAMLNDAAIRGIIKVHAYSDSARTLVAHGELEIVGRARGYLKLRIPEAIKLPGIAPWRGEPYDFRRRP